MSKVLYSLLPIILFATYLFGLRVLVLLSVVSLAGFLTEYVIMKAINGANAKVTEAVFVTSFLYTLTLPPQTPYWVAVLGIVFGVLFGKGVFGGFGKNVFNPALVGRCFVYIAFPAYMTVTWIKPFTGFPGGLIRYTGGVDALTSATSMIWMKNDGVLTSYWKLFLGNVTGSIGETSALLIILAGIYLIVTKTAAYKLILSSSLSFLLLNIILFYTGVITVDPLFSFLAGGFLFGSVFMVTDPISAPMQDTSKILYGTLIGILTVVIRSFSLFTEGIMFAILIANVFGPLMDKYVKEYKAKRKELAK
jgi:Na+-transporting NADH:ubiquinone oxidoreductase subunit B